MKPTKGYYSLIQFCPDQARLEAANVGVVLFCPELNALEVRIAGDNSRIQRFFGKRAFDWSRVNSYKQGIKERLEIEGKDFRNVEDLKAFGQRRGNSLQLTIPRPFTVRDPHKDIEELFDEVVGERKQTPAVKGFRKRITDQLLKAKLGPKLKQDIAIEVPSLRREIEFPFGYMNGRFNLIQPVSFQASNPDQVRRTASSHAIEGLALYEHPHKTFGALELVVVGQFRTNENEVREDVRRILQQGRVKLYATNEVDELITEIRVHGRELDTVGV